MAAIEVTDLVVDRGDLRAVDGVSLTVDHGQVVALLGPNGAGKTTTTETIAGLLAPSHGTVRVLGRDPHAERERTMAEVGVMPQAGGVYPGARPQEILELVARFHAVPQPADALLERVGLAHRARSPWRTLSGGEQQRLSLALALVASPRAVLLDEPTAGIDPAGRQLIRSLIADLRTEGAAVLVTTHDLEEAEKLAGTVVIIDRGRVVASGTPAELMRSAGTAEIRFSAPAGLDTADLGKTMLAGVVETAPGDYLVETEPTPANINTLTTWLALHDLPLMDLQAGRHSLEEVFLQMTNITGEVPAVRIAPHPSRRRRR